MGNLQGQSHCKSPWQSCVPRRMQFDLCYPKCVWGGASCWDREVLVVLGAPCASTASSVLWQAGLFTCFGVKSCGCAASHLRGSMGHKWDLVFSWHTM